jgi:chorismate mutase
MTTKTIGTPRNDTLTGLRISIDNIDNALITLLAERFRLTQKVGEFKRDAKLPAVDAGREARQFAAIRQRAHDSGLDSALAVKLWRTIIDEVVANHLALSESRRRHER